MVPFNKELLTGMVPVNSSVLSKKVDLKIKIKKDILGCLLIYSNTFQKDIRLQKKETMVFSLKLAFLKT